MDDKDLGEVSKMLDALTKRAELAVVNVAKFRAAVAAKKKDEESVKDQRVADASDEERKLGAEQLAAEREEQALEKLRAATAAGSVAEAARS